MTIKQKLVTAATVGSMLAATLLPGVAMADTTVKIKDNGADSHNKVKVSNDNSSTVKQSNNTVVLTGVFATSNTGGNTVSKNTGGGSKVKTGDATNNVTVAVEGSSNTASSNCGCEDHDTDVTIKDNGADSHNKVKVKNNNSSYTKQKNNTFVGTLIGVNADTGNNKVKKNTGGNSKVKTGDAENTVEVGVGGATNEL